jgi:hypothetical protein
MKYFKDSQNTVYAYESDGSQDALIKPGLIGITQEQADALRAAPPVIPTVISMRQAQQALLQSGYFDQIDALIAAMPGQDGKAARIDWKTAREVRRDYPLVGAIAAELSLTSQQLDDLFTLGASL